MVATEIASYSLLTGDYGPEPNVLYPIKRKMILSAQDSLKPFIFRTKGETSTRNFLRPIVHRKLYVPILLCPKLCRSDGFLDDYDVSEDSSKNLVSPSLVDGLIPSTPLVNPNSISKDIRNKIARKVLELEKLTGTVPVLGIVPNGLVTVKAPDINRLSGYPCKSFNDMVISLDTLF